MTFSAELRRAADPVWSAILAHPFVRGIGDGTLPEAAFRRYVRQDYLFLIDYGRLLSLGAARAPRLAWMRRFSALAESVLETEMDLHRAYAERWGISNDELESERTAPATDAYCDFLLRTATLGDFGELAAALAPCMWGYAEWIRMYASEEFEQLAAWARELVDAAAEGTGDAGRERMLGAFMASSEHELAFWDSAFSAAGATS